MASCMHASMHRMPFCLQARSVPEDCESADALKAVAEDITAQTFIVMSVDLVTDVCLEVSFSLS